MFPLEYLLRGQPLPTYDDLLARANPDGQELLVLAARFAAWRAAGQDAIRQQIDAVAAEPWLTADLRWCAPPGDQLTATDMLRALLVRRGDLVRDLVSTPARLAEFIELERSVLGS